jgi:arylformamidase
VEAQVVPAEGKTHVTINWQLGDPDDAPTGAVFDFLRGRCEKTSTR